MSNEWDDIGGKFKSTLDQYQAGEPIEPWDEFEKRVKRSNFLKFSMTTFNVYYLSVIVIVGFWAGVTTYSVINLSRQLNIQNNLITRNNSDSISKRKHDIAIITTKKITDSVAISTPIKNKVKNSLHHKELAMNMEESALFEGLIASNYRSNDINVSFPRINYAYNTGQPIVFKINGDLSEPLILILYNNKGEAIFERKNLSNNSISINNNLLPGLYYWKLLKYNDLLQTGKFFIK